MTYRLLLAFLACLEIVSAPQEQRTERSFGGYNGTFIASGLGLKKKLPPDSSVSAGGAWSMYCWMRSDAPQLSATLLAGIGDPTANDAQRYFAVIDTRLTFWAGPAGSLPGTVTLEPGKWHFLAASSDGTTTTFYVDQEQSVQKALSLPAVTPELHMAPQPMALPNAVHFAGQIAGFTFTAASMSADQIRALYERRPAFDVIEFENGSQNWPMQTRQQVGYRAPQDPDTMPRSSVPPSSPVAHDAAFSGPEIVQHGANEWAIQGKWTLAAASDVAANGAEISRVGFQTRGWWDATVPGTVLTTLVDRGVYPDPYHGLNNLAIPESLNKHDYWYRVEFTPPPPTAGRRLTLTFQGINYSAKVWLNGKRIGSITGAFIRGMFDVTNSVTPGKLNGLAVQVSPPPHPGIPQEQSVKGGPGENGGMMCLDGPTFIATEGWDWIPGIRDRNTGIWQPVTLTATDEVKIGDVHVVTALPLPDTKSATVRIDVPLRNESGSPVSGTLQASFEGVEVSKQVTLSPGDTAVTLAASEFPQLRVSHPRLWWPNGYGSPELYHLKVGFAGPKQTSDSKVLQFGIREISYELSLVDSTGRLQRLEYSPTEADGAQVVDIRHEGIIQTVDGWVYSLKPDAANSPAVRTVNDTRATPYLIVKVNGVRIACKGGNWGMDDALKRVSREHLEPYFRLHRNANLNIIRNWTGQSTEEVFYDLADEYGLLVWNDFWESTQNYNVEPSDTALFLNNARDTILRFRNHPSILVWCGRNEGVPSPAVNGGLDDLARTLDGTRFYAPSSNTVNLQNSGPYKYQHPVDYFTQFGHGFAVELGVPSIPTLDSFRSFVPQADQWPPNDTWAYHDWHQSGNGDVAPFMDAMRRELGAATDLEDFERKAQMLDYVQHRAIFEGFNAHLWSPNSGRMLWMTQPAWPSTMWQILSWDYDTQASFYGVQRASERVHVQLNLPDLTTAVINNTTGALGFTLRARVFSPDAKLLLTREENIDAAANAATNAFQIVLPADISGVVFVKLELIDGSGAMRSRNFYWYAREDASYRDLNSLPKAALTASASETRNGETVRISAHLENRSPTFALMTRLTVRNAEGMRVLPAYYDDNYVSLAPAEKREIQAEFPASAAAGKVQLGITGWNVQPATVTVTR